MPGQPGERSDRTRSVRILCVDDSPEIGRLLERLILTEPGVDSAGVLESAEGLTAEAEHRLADIVVIDLTMPGRSPLAAIGELTKRSECRVIAYSAYDDEATASMVIEAGACELVSKNVAPAALIEAIRRVAHSVRQNWLHSEVVPGAPRVIAAGACR